MLKKAVTVNNQGLLLEASLDFPEQTPGPWPGVVLFHPNPSYGGDMHNNIILALSWVLTGMGIACLRYNSRGVGHSQGAIGVGAPEAKKTSPEPDEGFFTSGQTSPELTDGRAALAFLLKQEEIDINRIGLVGYSFGGSIALPLGEENDLVKVIAAVSPVIPPGALAECIKPKMIILGDQDTMVLSEKILQGCDHMSEPKIIKVFPGMDHFWWGYEEEAANAIGGFVMKHIG